MLLTTIVTQPHAFEINNFRGLRDHVGFENQLAVLDDHPGSSLFDTSQAALAKTLRVHLHRVDTTLVKCELCLDWHHELQLTDPGRSKFRDWFASLECPDRK